MNEFNVRRLFKLLLLSGTVLGTAWNGCGDEPAEPPLAPIELTSVDDGAIAYATFQSHNQKVVSNRHGIFVTYLRSAAEDYLAQTWRLLQSTDGGRTFNTIFEETRATNPPVLETDQNGELYLTRPDFVDGHAYLSRFAAPDAKPVTTKLVGGSAGKFCQLLDETRQRIYYLAHSGAFHIAGTDGSVLKSAQLLVAGTKAVTQYPHLTLSDDGTLYAAWTTNNLNEYLYRSIQAMKSPDGGETWLTLDGKLLTLPIISDDTGPTTRISHDDELDVHSWLSSFLWKQGKLHFVYWANKRTAEAGFTGIYGGLNVIQADYDNDGALDLLVLRGGWLGEAGKHPKSLLRNNGRGEFTDVTFDVGLDHATFPSQTASWADYDLDGDLDLYIGNEKYPCQLFQNQGNGRFQEVTREAGVENLRFTKGVVWGDYDGDRWPDLYVSNLHGENRLYRNLGNGAFSDVAPELGVTSPMQSFPVWFWDFDNDGVLDIFVAAYGLDVRHVAASYLGLPRTAELCCLYRGNGSGGFEDVAGEMNLTRVTQPMGVNFGDLDNDGYLDFYLGTGYPGFEALMPNVMYRNQGGRHFADVTTAGGFGHLQKGHGIAFADLDQDGDQDVFAQLGGALKSDVFTDAVFENPGFGNNWLVVKLVGAESNRFGVGARIRANFRENGEPRDVFRWVNTGGSFGCNPMRQQIGLGQATTVETLEIFWPKTGRTQTFSNVPAGQMIEITEDQDDYRVVPYPSTPFRKKSPSKFAVVKTPE